jgi:glycerol-3-phosphate dehydrogenase
MKRVVEADVVIIGGGIAGLWLLNRLRQQGVSVILFESNTLGGGQTNTAQGIIHGGIKYALQGVLTPAAQAIFNMPTIWKQCLKGNGEIDLANVPVLSTNQYLWSTGSLSSKLTAFFAGLALKNTMQVVNKQDYPEIFRVPQFRGQVYSLAEMVIDVHALTRELVKPNQDVIFKIDPMDEANLQLDESDRLISLRVRTAPLPSMEVKAQKYIFTAGGGNELLINKLKNKSVKIQRRPLHMVMVKHHYTYPFFGHCLGMSTVPRITITTHQMHDGSPVWYLGGQIAEEGMQRTPDAQIRVVQKELAELFPWLDFSRSEFKTFLVDRVESLQPDGKRPDSCFLKEIENMILAWPTKLALAPLLAEKIIQNLLDAKIKPAMSDTRELRAWPIPALAIPMWDQLL